MLKNGETAPTHTIGICSADVSWTARPKARKSGMDASWSSSTMIATPRPLLTASRARYRRISFNVVGRFIVVSPVASALNTAKLMDAFAEVMAAFEARPGARFSCNWSTRNDTSSASCTKSERAGSGSIVKTHCGEAFLSGGQNELLEQHRLADPANPEQDSRRSRNATLSSVELRGELAKPGLTTGEDRAPISRLGRRVVGGSCGCRRGGWW
jgi:hypothetical protein